MNSILFIYIFSLFVVTSPNFIFKIPIKNHLVVAIIHAAIFSFILYFTYDIVNRDVLESATVNNGTKQDDGTVHTIDGGTTIVVNNSDKSPELNEIQKNAVNIAELEEQHNQSMLDAANNAAELAKSYAANAQASSTFAIQAASQYNSAATALRLATAAEQAAAEQSAAEQAAAEQSAAERERRRQADAEQSAAERERQSQAAAAAAAAEQARQDAIVRVTASVPNAVGTSDYTSGNWVQAHNFNQNTNSAQSNTYNLSIPATEQAKMYTAYTTGDTDTYLRVYIGNEQSEYDDDDGPANNASLQFTIPANHDCIVAYGMYGSGTGSTTLHFDPAASSGTAAAEQARQAAAAEQAQQAAAATAAAAAEQARQAAAATAAAAAQGYTNIGSQNFGSYGSVVTGGQYITDSYPSSLFCLVLETNGSLRLIRGISPTGPTIWSYESGRSPGNSQAKWEGDGSGEGAFTIRYNGSAIWSIPGSNVGMGKGLILQGGQVTLRTVGNGVVWQNP